MTKPVNCFLLYCEDYRTLISITHPYLSNSEVTSILGKNWRNLDTKKKLEYKQRAKELELVSIV